MELYPIQWENHSVSVVGRPRIRDTLCIDGLSGQPKFLVGTPRAVSNYKDTIFIGLFWLESVSARAPSWMNYSTNSIAMYPKKQAKRWERAGSCK